MALHATGMEGERRRAMLRRTGHRPHRIFIECEDASSVLRPIILSVHGPIAADAEDDWPKAL